MTEGFDGATKMIKSEGTSYSMEITDKANDIQRRLSTLLKEISEICKENEIRYTLFGYTGASAVATGEIGVASAAIMVDADGLKRLIDVMNKGVPENRAFDYMGNNQNYKSFSARYSDTETSYIELGQSKNFYASGLFVEIVVLRRTIKNKLLRTRLNVLEHGWEGTFKQPGMFTTKAYSMAKSLVGTGCLLLGRKTTSKFIFNQLMKGYRGKSANGSFYVKRFNKKITSFRFNPLAKLTEAYVYDEPYTLTKQRNAFLSATYTPNWRSAAKKQSVLSTKNIVSPYVPYKEMLDSLSVNGDAFNTYLKAYKAKWKRHSRFVKYDKKKADAWLTAKRTGDRLDLAEHYRPLMSRIRELRANRDYYALSKIMHKHRRVLVRHLNRGEGFAVNRELFEIQMELFSIEGKDNIVNKLRQITPEVYMKEIS